MGWRKQKGAHVREREKFQRFPPPLILISFSPSHPLSFPPLLPLPASLLPLPSQQAAAKDVGGAAVAEGGGAQRWSGGRRLAAGLAEGGARNGRRGVEKNRRIGDYF